MGQPHPRVGEHPADVRWLPPSAFQLASQRALVRTDDGEFLARFQDVFLDCLVPMPSGSPQPVVLEVIACQPGDSVVAYLRHPHISLGGPSMASLFPELDLVPAATAEPDGESWALRQSPSQPVIALGQGSIRVHRELPWRILLTHYLLHHLMRLQPDWLFFHGATLAMDESGVLLTGDKGAGKSTLSLALAARGHGFLGDELAAVQADGADIAPFRRAVSIRRGPQTGAVREYLESGRAERVTMADGTDRVRLPVSRIFPGAMPRPVRLTHAIFLGGESVPASVEAFDFSLADVRLLSPTHGTMRRQSTGDVVTILNLFRRVRCFRVARSGTPDETAELIEAIVEGKWDTACRKEPSVSARFAGSKSS